MDKKFVFVRDLTVIKKVVIGAGIVISIFCCTENTSACDTFVVDDRPLNSEEMLYPYISTNFEITLSPNTSEQVINRDFTDIEGGMDNVLERFVSSILSHTKPLDGDISKFVDENFWDFV